MIKSKNKISKFAKKEQRAAYLFLIPAFLGLSFITYLPILAVFGISFTNLNSGHFVAAEHRSLAPVEFTAFDNYVEIFQNPSINFLNSIQVTLYFTLIAVVGSIIYSLFIAILLNRKIPARGFFRAVFYLPYILPATAVMIGWRFLYDYNNGLMNHILVSLGFPRSYFLDDKTLVYMALALISIWTCGNLIVIFLAGLQNVPRAYHEAAEIDGANSWQRFWRITIPCMTPIIFFNLLMSVVTNLQIVIPALAITKGAPGQSTKFMTYMIYEIGFKGRQLGTASAISFVFFIVAALLALMLFAVSRKWIFYEGEEKE